MASKNLVILIGNISSDIDSRHTPGGKHVVNFSVATNYKEDTEFHKVIAWEKLADNINTYCHKGKQVYVEGRLQTRKWQDKQGNDRYTTEIIAHQVQFLGAKGEAKEPPSAPEEEEPPF